MSHSPRPHKTANLPESVNRRLNMYALAAGAAGVGMLAFAQPAEGKIVYTHVHVNLVGDKAFPIDLNHDDRIDFYLLLGGGRGDGSARERLWACHQIVHGTSSDFCSGSTSATNALNAIRVLRSNSAAALRAGARIRNGNRFRDKTVVDLGGVRYKTVSTSTSTGLNWYGAWVNGGKGVKNRYLGLKFKINGRFHFGWARLTITTQKKSFTATVTGYAYETIPGKAIIAGQTKGTDVVTMPMDTRAGTLGHLALGRK